MIPFAAALVSLVVVTQSGHVDVKTELTPQECQAAQVVVLYGKTLQELQGDWNAEDAKVREAWQKQNVDHASEHGYKAPPQPHALFPQPDTSLFRTVSCTQ